MVLWAEVALQSLSSSLMLLFLKPVLVFRVHFFSFYIVFVYLNEYKNLSKLVILIKLKFLSVKGKKCFENRSNLG